MLIERDRSALLVVDIQERLLPHIHEGQAVLDNADLSEAACAKACFERASLKGALLMKTDLTGARMSGANLMQVVAQHAILNGADLTDTNLYAADLARVDVDTETKLDNAFMAKARTMPRHKVEPPASRRET